MSSRAVWHLLQQAGYTADLDFYESFTIGHGPVLELGAGGGRVAAHLTEEVDGVDIDPELLADAEHLFRNTYVADVTRMALRRRYARIIAPVSMIQIVPPESRPAMLRRIFEHLEPGGLVALDVMDLCADEERGQRITFRRRLTRYSMWTTGSHWVADDTLQITWARRTWHPRWGRRELAPWTVDYSLFSHEQLVREAQEAGLVEHSSERFADEDFAGGSVMVFQCPRS